MLLHHNAETLRQLEHYTDRNQNCCVVNPCGSGKTSVMAEFIRHNPDKRILIVTKQANAKQYYCDRDPIFKTTDIVTYAKFGKDYTHGMISDYRADIYIFDEAHYMGAAKWEQAIAGLVRTYSPLLVGFTATPQRFEQQGTAETIVTQWFNGHSAGNYTSKSLQKSGLFVEPKYVLSLWNFETDVMDLLAKLDDSDLDKDTKQMHRKTLKTALTEWRTDSCPAKVLSDNLPNYMYKSDNNRILVYMSSAKEIHEKQDAITSLIQSIFPDQKITAYRYTYKDSEKILKQFQTDDNAYIKILYSIDKIMETIHIDDLNVTIMLRPSISNRIITQQFGRTNSINNDKQALIVDMVGNLSKLNSISFDKQVNVLQTMAHSATKFSIRFDTSHTAKYINLFAAIDNTLRRTEYYTYHGITDTLRILCQIFYRPLSKVKKEIQCGATIEQAFAAVPMHISDKEYNRLLNGTVHLPTCTLTPEQWQTVNRYQNNLDAFINRRHITDEDMKQNLYLELAYAVAMHNGFESTLYPHIQHRLLHTYIQTMQLKMFRSEIICGYSDEPICCADFTDQLLTYMMSKNFRKEIWHMLTDREQTVLTLRFGFNNEPTHTLRSAAEQLNLSTERIRQIECKAIRKISRTAYRKYRELCL